MITESAVWEPKQDEFRYSWPMVYEERPITKTIVLSELSSLLDPLGKPVMVGNRKGKSLYAENMNLKTCLGYVVTDVFTSVEGFSQKSWVNTSSMHLTA